jgi:hypothetical protein
LHVIYNLPCQLINEQLLLGIARNSRLEYKTLKGRYKDDYDFQINIQTTSDNGIIFYASDFNRQDLIAVYIIDGKVKQSFIYLAKLFHS